MNKLNAVVAGAALAISGVAFAAGGSIAGTVALEGTAPKMEELKRGSDAFCGKKKMTDETVLTTKDGKALQNVVIRITKAATALPAAKPGKEIEVDQVDCMYRPRVQVATEGTKVMIKNTDGTMHNVHSYAGTKTLFNQAQPPKSAALEKEAKGGDVIKFKCDVHPWMTGYVVTSKNTFFAVTGEDGKFEIKDVPAGKYTVEAWHEKLGTKTAEITVEDGKPVDPKFALAAK